MSRTWRDEAARAEESRALVPGALVESDDEDLDGLDGMEDLHNVDSFGMGSRDEALRVSGHFKRVAALLVVCIAALVLVSIWPDARTASSGAAVEADIGKPPAELPAGPSDADSAQAEAGGTDSSQAGVDVGASDLENTANGPGPGPDAEAGSDDSKAATQKDLEESEEVDTATKGDDTAAKGDDTAAKGDDTAGSTDEGEPPKGGTGEGEATGGTDGDEPTGSTDGNDTAGEVSAPPPAEKKRRVLLVTGFQFLDNELMKDFGAALCKPAGARKCERLCKPAARAFVYKQVVDKYNKARQGVVADLKRAATADSDTLFWLGGFGACSAEEYSPMTFPPTDDPLDSIRHPDLLDYARIAEEVGVELRVLVPTMRDVSRLALAWLQYGSGEADFTSHGIIRLESLEAQVHALLAQMVQLPPSARGAVDIDAWRWAGAPSESLESFTGLPGADTWLESVRKQHASSGNATAPAELLAEGWPGATGFVEGMQAAWLTLQRALRSGAAAVPSGTVRKGGAEGRPRLIFFAGLEGTGHHMWKSVMTELVRSNTVSKACEVSKLLFNMRSKHSLWHAGSIRLYEEGRSLLLEELGKLEATTPSLGSMLKGCGSTGMMSYPNFGGPNKNTQRPNLVSLAQLAERAGVDLQVVVLMRDAEAIVVSDVDHRHFGTSEGNEMHMLESNAEGLLAQLATLDRQFVAGCVQFEDSAFSFTQSLEQRLGVTGIGAALSAQAHLDKAHDPAPYSEMQRRARYIKSMDSTQRFTLEQLCPEL